MNILKTQKIRSIIIINLKVIGKIYNLLDKNCKKNFLYIQFLYLIQAVFELVGLVSVYPLIMVITLNSVGDFYNSFPFLKNFFYFENILELQILLLSLFLITIILLNIIIFINFYFTETLIKKIYISIADRLIYSYLEKSAFLDKENEISDKINNVTYNLQTATINIFRNLLRSNPKIYTIVILAISFLYVDLTISVLLILIALLFYFLVFRNIKKKLGFWGKLSSENNKDIVRFSKEVFSNFKLVKIDKLSNYLRGIFLSLYSDQGIAHQNIQVITFFSRVIIETLAITLICILMMYYLATVSSDTFLPLITFYLYGFFRIFPPMQQIFQSYSNIKSWSYLMDKLYIPIKKENDEIILNNKENNIDEKSKKFFESNIVIKDLYFSYDQVNILENINFKFNKSNIIGIKGKSGSGKSTLLNILCGLLKVKKGQILIDGINLSRDNMNIWHKLVSYVPQDIFLFNDTLKKNILLNKNNISQKYLDQVLLISGVQDILNKKNIKLDTIVNENSLNFSGGERQRIGIARSLIKNPELLIFDETTSGLEIDSEKKIIYNIKKHFDKITIILISHREKSLEICEQVLELG